MKRNIESENDIKNTLSNIAEHSKNGKRLDQVYVILQSLFDKKQKPNISNEQWQNLFQYIRAVTIYSLGAESREKLGEQISIDKFFDAAFLFVSSYDEQVKFDYLYQCAKCYMEVYSKDIENNSYYNYLEKALEAFKQAWLLAEKFGMREITDVQNCLNCIEGYYQYSCALKVLEGYDYRDIMSFLSRNEWHFLKNLSSLLHDIKILNLVEFLWNNKLRESLIEKFKPVFTSFHSKQKDALRLNSNIDNFKKNVTSLLDFLSGLNDFHFLDEYVYEISKSVSTIFNKKGEIFKDDNQIERADKLVQVARLSVYPQHNNIFMYPGLWLDESKELKKLREDLKKSLNEKNTPQAIQAQKLFNQEVIDLLKKSATYCTDFLGDPPCHFNWIVIGSLSRYESGPYSDLDCALLIADVKYQENPYFEQWINLINFKLKLMGGFYIDVGDLKYLTENDRPFLSTPQGLADYVNRTQNFNKFSIEAYSLRWPISLYWTSAQGKKLLADYKEHLKTYWLSNHTSDLSYTELYYLHQARKDLKEHQSQFKEVLKITDEDGPRGVDLKRCYIEPLTFWCLDIALFYYPSVEKLGNISFLNIVQWLEENKCLSSNLIYKLCEIFKYLQYLRLDIQEKTSQGNLIITFDKSAAKTNIFPLNEEQKKYLNDIKNFINILYSDFNIEYWLKQQSIPPTHLDPFDYFPLHNILEKYIKFHETNTNYNIEDFKNSEQIRINLIKSLPPELINLEEKNQAGKTALHLVVQTGSRELFEILFDSVKCDHSQSVKIDGTDNRGNTALQYASQGFSQYQNYYKVSANNNNKSNKIIDYLDDNYCFMIETLIDRDGSLLNKANHKAQTPLLYAIEYSRRVKIVKILLDKSAKLQPDKEANTELHLAVRGDNRYSLTVLLLENGYDSDVNKQNKDGDTPLHLLIKKFSGCIEKKTPQKTSEKEEIIGIIGKLFNCGASANIKNCAQKGPIELTEDGDIISVLTRGTKNSHPSSLDDSTKRIGRSRTAPSFFSDTSRSVNTSRNLGRTFREQNLNKSCNETRAQSEFEIKTLFIDEKCIIEMDYRAIHKWLENHSSTDLADMRAQNRDTVLHLIIKRYISKSNLDTEEKTVDLIKLLINKLDKIKRRADFLKNKNTQQETPLLLAVAHSGSVLIVKTLINLKADLQVKDKDNNTVLHLAINSKINTCELTELILKTQKDLINKKNNDQVYPIHSALNRLDDYSEDSKYADIIKFLLNQDNIIFNVLDNHKQSPLHLAVFKSNKDIVKIILRHPCNIGDSDEKGHTPLHLAIIKYRDALDTEQTDKIKHAKVIIEYILEKRQELSADAGQALADYAQGLLYEKSYKKLKKACDFYQKSANRGYYEADKRLHTIWCQSAKLVENQAAYHWFKNKAKDDDVDSKWNLARMLECGNGVVQDIKEAYRYYKEAASLGDEKSKRKCEELAVKLPKDFIESLPSIKKSIQTVTSPGCDRLDSKSYAELQKAISLWVEKYSAVGTMARSLSDQARAFGYDCKDVTGEGNCFFHAVLDQLKISGEKFHGDNHTSLREKTTHHIIEHLKLYQDYIDEDINKFIDRITQAGEWADHLMIQAIARVLNINIVIIRSDGADPTIIKRSAATTIYLGYEVGWHYQSLILAPGIVASRSINDYLQRAEIDSIFTDSSQLPANLLVNIPSQRELPDDPVNLKHFKV